MPRNTKNQMGRKNLRHLQLIEKNESRVSSEDSTIRFSMKKKR